MFFDYKKFIKLLKLKQKFKSNGFHRVHMLPNFQTRNYLNISRSKRPTNHKHENKSDRKFPLFIQSNYRAAFMGRVT